LEASYSKLAGGTPINDESWKETSLNWANDASEHYPKHPKLFLLAIR
jgi:hypothetical protein